MLYYRWNDALIDLVEALGPDNVFVSIYESGSIDNSKEMLEYLDSQLSIRFPSLRKEIRMDNTTHEDEINFGPYDENGTPRHGWVLPPKGTDGKKLRRIPFLSRIRNISLLPLLKEQAAGRTYDKILFLNDVVFTPADALTLLATNQGSYSAACALDFHEETAYLAPYYDSFVLRDTNHEPHMSLQFPYFRPSDSLNSMWQGRPTKVSACWNGMLFMDAAAFYGPRSDLLPQPIDSTELGLPFRGVPDSLASHHLEGSECCLIHTDYNTINPNHSGLYVNPSVRVAYSIDAYANVHANTSSAASVDGVHQQFLSATQYLFATYLHRLNRIRTPTYEKQSRGVHAKVQKWLKEEGTLAKREKELGAAGEMCIIDEMHLLMKNGWYHV